MPVPQLLRVNKTGWAQKEQRLCLKNARTAMQLEDASTARDLEKLTIQATANQVINHAHGAKDQASANIATAKENDKRRQELMAYLDE